MSTMTDQLLTSNTLAEPKLGQPGAGLPFLEWAMAKYILLPRYFRETSKQKAIDLFALESKKIKAKVRKLSPAMLSERRLIPRLQGLEDNSRYWSVAMTLQHLIISADSIAKLVGELAHGGTNLPPFKIANIKPDPNVDAATIVQAFEESCGRFVSEMTAINAEAFPKVTYRHPWFGSMNAEQWVKFATPHQHSHREQIEAIIERLYGRLKNKLARATRFS
jgi:hypothetical protein